MSEEEQEQQRQQQRWDSRPVSTIAQNFAADLDSMFGLTPEVEELSKNVEQNSGEQELQELEARLKAAEQRLARVSRHNSPSRVAESGEDAQQASGEAARPHPLAQRPSYPVDRPATSDETEIAQREGRQPMMMGMANGATTAPQQMNGEYARSQRGYG
ncbi:uncharacterized protein RCC_02769 [Ramularia collo-cygni]|uniref:Uncharacterized protein n=1 Tax=Ramularia collo-cygni TaxID=112498 RepID=A0A2D3USW5_9PEZI|nr:uncharacterized protein RCC_02769 [Ramularia collo-cygni]CZT16935.1 uncharacterized protein RCC_02769 [Ramularia collo-cygni]